MTTATRFRRYQDVVIVEHDDRTREPKQGGEVMQPATVTAIEGAYVRARTEFGITLVFWAESGWTAWDGMFQWRLVPVCRCGKPILGDPVTDPDDPRHEEFCSEDCITTAAERSSGAMAAIEYSAEFD
jgi:hypothetical protein